MVSALVCCLHYASFVIRFIGQMGRYLYVELFVAFFLKLKIIKFSFLLEQFSSVITQCIFLKATFWNRILTIWAWFKHKLYFLFRYFGIIFSDKLFMHNLHMNNKVIPGQSRFMFSFFCQHICYNISYRYKIY